jgi:multidrug efflux pump subunit AcrA (membrane-fusion protein)
MAKPNMLITAVRGKFLACLLLPLTMFLGCTPQDKQSEQVSRPVKVVRIGDEVAAGVMSFAGEVRARYETILAFRVSGKMIDRPVEVGDRVHKGQRVARLDSNDYQLGTDALKAQLTSAQAERDFARDDLTRYRELLNLRVISPAEFDRHDTAYTTARERVVALEAQLSQATNQLQYTDLLADRDVRQFDAGLEHTGRQPRERLRRGIGVDRRQRAGVPRIQCLKEIVCFPAADFADDHPIRPMPERGPQQVADRDGREIALRAPRLEANDVGLVDLQLRGILDNDNSIALRNEGRQRIEQRRLAGAGTATDQDVLACVDRVLSRTRRIKKI